jgi:hypothetical protein
VQIRDQDEHPTAGVPTPQPDVQQSALVAKADLPRPVDAVLANRVVHRSDEPRTSGTRLRSCFERFDRSSPPESSVGTFDVVVLTEPVELLLELLDVASLRLLGQPPLLGLVEPLHFPAGLGVVGAECL